MSGYDEIGAGCFADGYIAEAWKRRGEKIEKQMQAHKYVMREPKVENKYHLTVPQIKKLCIADHHKIKEKPFWRNEQICAWCLYGHAGTRVDEEFGTDDEYWMGFYDDDAPEYAGEFRFRISAYGGMCNYNFDAFFVPETIKCENDLRIQELFLKRINWLLDKGILKDLSMPSM